MDWTTLLRDEAKAAYHAAKGLVRLVEAQDLAWKPATGSNWMTVGQLLEHLSTACGQGCKGFVTGDWGVPPGTEADMPTARTMPSVASAGEALTRLEADEKVTGEMIAKAGERDLEGRRMPAPWDPSTKPLGAHLLQMVNHLVQHKGQLFYYLKLMGRPVHTGHLWGM